MDFSEFQLKELVKLLNSSTGILVAVMFALLLICTAVVRPARWWSLTMILYAVTMGVPDLNTRFFTPVGEIAQFSRPLCAALLVALMVPAIRSGRGWRMQTAIAGLIYYFAFELVLSIRTLSLGAFAKGYFGAISFGLVFMVLAVGLNRWLQSLKDVYTALRCMAWAGALTIVGTLLQMAIDRNTVIWANRLHGTTANANFLGTLLATTFLPTAFLATRSRANFPGRIFYSILMALSGVMIVWTGSRTATLMAFSGIVIMFRRHLGRFVIVGAFTCALSMMVWNYYAPNIEATSSRVMDLSDTRSGTWKQMVDEFLNDPVFGYGTPMVGGSENSYLLAARTTGIIGLVPLIVSIVLIFKSVRDASRRVPRRGPYRDLSDLVMAGVASLLIGGLFEGYLCGFYSVPVIALYIYCALIAFLQDSACASEQSGLGFPNPLDAGSSAVTEPDALDPQMPMPAY